jgi:hypothetical protein
MGARRIARIAVQVSGCLLRSHAPCTAHRRPRGQGLCSLLGRACINAIRFLYLLPVVWGWYYRKVQDRQGAKEDSRAFPCERNQAACWTHPTVPLRHSWYCLRCYEPCYCYSPTHLVQARAEVVHEGRVGGRHRHRHDR